MIKIIKEVNKQDLREFMYEEFPNISDDPKLYECLNSGKAVNVFQMSAGTASGVVRQIKPDNLSELTACNAFARPGTIDAVPAYVDGKDGKSKYHNEIINSVFGETFSVCLYQEQVMKIVEKLSPKKEKIVIHLEDGFILSLDPDDEVKTNNGNKKASELTENDEVL